MAKAPKIAALLFVLACAALACVESVGPSYGNIGDNPGPPDDEPDAAKDAAKDGTAIVDAGAETTTPDADE